MTFITALALFALLTMILLAVEIMFTYATKGFGYGFSSNRDPNAENSQLATRIKRIYLNQVESAAYIVPTLAAAAILDLEGGGVEMAAHLIILGRLAFAILYYTGIPFIRVPAFLLANVPTLYLAITVIVTIKG